MTDTEKLIEARKMSPGIAEWIDAQVARGASPASIVRVLKATVEMARSARKLEGGRVG